MEEEGLQRKGNWILVIAISLTIIGLLMIFGTSSIVIPGSKKLMYCLLVKQLLWAILGISLVFFIVKKKLEWWNKYSFLFLIISLVLLFSTLFFPPINRAQRWAFGCQPSEFTNVFFILYLSLFFSKKKPEGKNFFAPLFFLVIISSILVSQPHMSRTIFLCLLTFSVFFLAGLKIKYIFIFLFIFSVVMVPIIKNTPYAEKRSKKENPYHALHAEIALGSGGLLGVGLGGSMQKLSCLPLAYSDSIFAILGEEGGFLLGSFALFFLFALFAYLGFSIAWYSPSTNGFFLAFFLTLSIVVQAIVNIAAISNVIPVIGLPLPFMSYGGSSLISNFMSVGFIISCARAK